MYFSCHHCHRDKYSPRLASRPVGALPRVTMPEGKTYRSRLGRGRGFRLGLDRRLLSGVLSCLLFRLLGGLSFLLLLGLTLRSVSLLIKVFSAN